MTNAEPAPQAKPPPAQCLAIPGAARHGWREDALCASLAKTEVDFHGRTMPVCRMHEATYLRWGETAEQNAAELWDWDPEPPAST
jgi:hypothetical protein